MPNTWIDAIASLYSAGSTLQEVATQLGVSSETVRRALINAGVPRRRRGQPVGKFRKRDGVLTDPDGYVLLRRPDHPFGVNGYVRRSRLIMERSLGRPLAPGEVVCHLNGDKADDRPENLHVFASSSALAKETLRHNSHSLGDAGNAKRRVRRTRSESQILWELAALRWNVGRPIRRSDLHPPHPSWRAVARRFGTWRAGVEEALRRYPEHEFSPLVRAGSAGGRPASPEGVSLAVFDPDELRLNRLRNTSEHPYRRVKCRGGVPDHLDPKTGSANRPASLNRTNRADLAGAAEPPNGAH